MQQGDIISAAAGGDVGTHQTLLSLAEFNRRGQQLKELMHKARDAEHEAFSRLKGVQQEILRCITSGNQRGLDVYEAAYCDAEEQWRARALYSAELRGEMQDLVRERHGDDSNWPSERAPRSTPAIAGAAAAAGQLVVVDEPHASPSRRGPPVLPLSATKPVPVRAEDIGAALDRRPVMQQEAYPTVDPVASNQYMPLKDADLVAEFEELDTARSGELPLPVVIDYFGRKEALGVPASAVAKYVTTNLARFNADLRRKLARRGELVVEDDLTTVTFDEFSYLMVKWAQM